jgi:hypothetical protein
MIDNRMIDVIWYCAGHGNVGIVRVQQGSVVQYYVGQCSGLDEQRDKTWIADYGSKFPPKAGQILFGDIIV